MGKSSIAIFDFQYFPLPSFLYLATYHLKKVVNHRPFFVASQLDRDCGQPWSTLINHLGFTVEAISGNPYPSAKIWKGYDDNHGIGWHWMALGLPCQNHIQSRRFWPTALTGGRFQCLCLAGTWRFPWGWVKIIPKNGWLYSNPRDRRVK